MIIFHQIFITFTLLPGYKQEEGVGPTRWNGGAGPAEYHYARLVGCFHWDWFAVISSLFHTVLLSFFLSWAHAQSSSRREPLQRRWLHLHWCQHWWPLPWQGISTTFEQTLLTLTAYLRLYTLSPSLLSAKMVRGSRRTIWSSANARSPKKLDSETLGIVSIMPCATIRLNRILLPKNTHFVSTNQSKIMFAWAKHAQPTEVPNDVGFSLQPDEYLVLQVCSKIYFSQVGF